MDCSSPSPSRFSEVYEELLRPFGGRIPKRVKTQVAAAAELGDVKARKNWNGDVKPRRKTSKARTKLRNPRRNTMVYDS